jgi:tetratricopeptide (TPR) repeat protein
MVDGVRMASQHGADAYGRFMAVGAADDLFTLGRWRDAQRASDAVADDKLSLTGRLLLRLVKARLATGLGELEHGLVLLDGALALVTADSAPSFPVVLHAALAELELWRGRPHDAQAAISRGLEVINDRADVLYAPGLLATGVRVEADLAAAVRDRGGSPQDDGALARAGALVDRLSQIAGRASKPAGSLPVADASLALAIAEQSRAGGTPSVRAWLNAGRLWAKLAQPPVAAYAKLREAEARLAVDVDHVEAAIALRRAYSAASELGAQPLARHACEIARQADVDISFAPGVSHH